jgi:uncharacterized membrane protein (DUF485 family)
MSNWKQGYIPNNTKVTQQPRRENHQPQRYATTQHYPTVVEKRKRSITLLISLVLGALFFIVLVCGTFSRADSTLSRTANSMNDVGFQLGTMIGAALMIPQIIATGIAVILNGVGWGLRSSGFSLSGAIIYCVAAILMIINAPFLLPSIILSFVGYSKLKKHA